MKKRQNAMSPYHRHEKRPYRYSELYERWHTARLSGKDGEARKLGADHTALHMGRGGYVRAVA